MLASQCRPSKRVRRERADVDALEAADVHVDVIGVRAGHVEPRDPAVPAELVLRRARCRTGSAPGRRRPRAAGTVPAGRSGAGRPSACTSSSCTRSRGRDRRRPRSARARSGSFRRTSARRGMLDDVRARRQRRAFHDAPRMLGLRRGGATRRRARGRIRGTAGGAAARAARASRRCWSTPTTTTASCRCCIRSRRPASSRRRSPIRCGASSAASPRWSSAWPASSAPTRRRASSTPRTASDPVPASHRRHRGRGRGLRHPRGRVSTRTGSTTWRTRARSATTRSARSSARASRTDPRRAPAC